MPNFVEIGQTEAEIWWFFNYSRWRPSATMDLLCGWLDNARMAFGGLYHCAKCGWNRCSCFDNMQVLVFCDFGWKQSIHAPFWRFWGHISHQKCHSSS